MLKIIKGFSSTELDTDSRGRIFFYDNLKFWLILFVVVGHFVNPVTGYDQVYKGLFMFIYTFHMPLFIFVTGYFAKSVMDKATGGFRFEKMLHFFIFYVFLTVVIFLINFYLRENTNSYKFFQPVNPGWYLMSTMIWYGLIPIINRVKAKYVIIGGIIIALLVGYDAMVGDFLSLSRTICFFPFFIAGYYFTQEKTEKFLKWGGSTVRIVSLIFIIAFLVFCLWDPVSFYSCRMVVSPHYSYEEMKVLGDMYKITGPIARLLWFAGASVVSMAFMIIVNRSKTWYSKVGQRSLQVYIWHAIAVRLLEYAGLYKLVELSDSWYIIALPVVIAIGLTFLFAWKPLGAPFNWVLKQKFQFLFSDSKKDNASGKIRNEGQ